MPKKHVSLVIKTSLLFAVTFVLSMPLVMSLISITLPTGRAVEQPWVPWLRFALSEWFLICGHSPREK